ncbi:MAG: hypothetical protein GQ532_02290, partial [Methylomarinum sp.]|nr:hypothetical protein [Methylomarinum sp.]
MIYIGVDPDVDKSGFAAWDSRLKQFSEISDYRIFSLLARIDDYLADGHDVTVVIEAGFLNNKSNFHGTVNQSKSVGEKIALSVGANHQVGRIIAEYCQIKKIKFLEQKPLPKKWGKKRDSKINAEEFKKISDWNGKTNPEKRDAAMM